MISAPVDHPLPSISAPAKGTHYIRSRQRHPPYLLPPRSACVLDSLSVPLAHVLAARWWPRVLASGQDIRLTSCT